MADSEFEDDAFAWNDETESQLAQLETSHSHALAPEDPNSAPLVPIAIETEPSTRARVHAQSSNHVSPHGGVRQDSAREPETNLWQVWPTSFVRTAR